MSIGRLLKRLNISHSLRTLAVVGVGVSITSSAGAQPYPTFPVCDVKFMQSLQQKGHAEAMREVQVNETVITKPDSILALSCFDEHINQIAQGDSIFSRKYSGGPALDGDINTTIGSAFTTFISDNFQADIPPNVGAGTSFSSSSGGYGACDRIKQIWTAVKCSVVDYNHFVSLDDFRARAAAGTDTASSSNFDCSRTGTLDPLYSTGVVAALELNTTRTNRNSGAPAGYEYFDIVRPNYCATDPKDGPAPLTNTKVCTLTVSGGTGGTDQYCSDMPAIPTGAVISYTAPPSGITAGDQVWAFQCLNPGCYFDPAANASSIGYTPGGIPPSGLKCTFKPY